MYLFYVTVDNKASEIVLFFLKFGVRGKGNQLDSNPE